MNPLWKALKLICLLVIFTFPKDMFLPRAKTSYMRPVNALVVRNLPVPLLF
uniref:Uncharacterized protein n=1 Tax=Rhizophora mucronata TaxID=61149 RepID=A0A2P2NA36_RHIMU